MFKKSISFLLTLLIAALLLTGCGETGRREELTTNDREASRNSSERQQSEINETSETNETNATNESTSGKSVTLPAGDMVYLSYFRDEDEIPSLATIMYENGIDFNFMGATVTEGYMFINSILAFLGEYEPEYFSVQIYEETFVDVDDVWGAIDVVGSVYSGDYNFWVNYAPTDYPDFGPDYRYCELIKQSEIEPTVLLFIASIYSKDDKTIIFQYGIMNQVMSDSHMGGIGPLNLEKIAETHFSE